MAHWLSALLLSLYQVIQNKTKQNKKNETTSKPFVSFDFWSLQTERKRHQSKINFFRKLIRTKISGKTQTKKPYTKPTMCALCFVSSTGLTIRIILPTGFFSSFSIYLYVVTQTRGFETPIILLCALNCALRARYDDNDAHFTLCIYADTRQVARFIALTSFTVHAMSFDMNKARKHIEEIFKHIPIAHILFLFPSGWAVPFAFLFSVPWFRFRCALCPLHLHKYHRLLCVV